MLIGRHVKSGNRSGLLAVGDLSTRITKHLAHEYENISVHKNGRGKEMHVLSYFMSPASHRSVAISVTDKARYQLPGMQEPQLILRPSDFELALIIYQ